MGVDSSSRLTTLTTDFHEFIGQVTKENQAVLQYGVFFQWDEQVRKDNPVPSGPLNPQALNRYSYVLNNPLRYVDPTGHYSQIHFQITFNKPEDIWYLQALVQTQKQTWSNRGALTGGTYGAGTSIIGAFSTLPALSLFIAADGMAGAALFNQMAGGANASDFEQLATVLATLEVGSKLDISITYYDSGEMGMTLNTGKASMYLGCQYMCSAAGFANILNLFLNTQEVWMNAPSGKGISLEVFKALN